MPRSDDMGKSGTSGTTGMNDLDTPDGAWLADSLVDPDEETRRGLVDASEWSPGVGHRALASTPVRPPTSPSRRHARRVRPSGKAWSDTMATLMKEHARHGELCLRVVEREAAALGVAPTTVERRYGEHLRRAELAGSGVLLSEAEREVLRDAPSLRTAHAILKRAGRELPFAHLERAVWVEQGDRDLVALRRAETVRRSAERSRSGCAVCRGDDDEEAL